MGIKKPYMERCKRFKNITLYGDKKQWLCKGFKVNFYERIGATECPWGGYPPDGIEDCKGYEPRNDRKKL